VPSKNQNILRQEVKDLRKWLEVACSWIEGLHSTCVTYLIFRFNKIPIETSVIFC
jgi:hypothetical protein